ncbi:UvrD-helicase domain-containing protein [Nocardioides nanhaiensis]|uniref:RecBCD enzyme subunit RecB n=1 Tax=Nocardioides nanhaiensis TaxID=1476871 RepID=A0ABP8WBL5_9ACTN
MSPFSIRDPLPEPGTTTLLEASAGTGKTWTIGALVARWVAEGVAGLGDMLVITFGRAASQELRERVREQLVEAERALDPAPAAPSAADLEPEPSELVALLLDCPPAERAARHTRVLAALADFDAATIATTHQFCSLVLDSLGVAGDTDPRARLVEQLDDLVGEVVDDLYLRAFAHADAAPEFGHGEALAIARAVVGDPQAVVQPVGEDPSTPAGRRVAFAEAVRREVDLRKRRLGLLSYDDLLSQLAGALEPADSPARVRMRERWRIVLVDEFQDTDPVQWSVLDRAFSGVATMVLIGDPKQAIYAFRGGDVTTYLRAAAEATTEKTLALSWRSDAALLAATQQLLEGAELGDPRIVVRPVEAHHAGPRLQGAPVAAPLRLRAVRRSDLGRRGSAPLPVGDVRRHVALDLARDVRRLLGSGATFAGRPLEPADVAVICYRNNDLAAAQQALAAEGIPAVMAGGGSVFATPAAVEWLTLLEALEQPHRSPRVRAAALTAFLGLDAATLDAGGDRLTDELADRLRGWVDLVARRGVAAVLESAGTGGLSARVLAQVGGDRRLTDLRHVGEVLHEVALRERLGVVALLAWLREQVREAQAGRGAERTRRLDSDAAAVQLVTIHASKGLQYPVVYLPSLADRFVGKPVRPLLHDAEGERCLDVGGPGGSRWSEHVRRAADEEAGEWLRLLYVAITRAQAQVVLWWAPTRNAIASPLHRLLAREAGSEVPETPSLPSDDDLVALLTRWRDRGGPAPEVARPADPGAAPAVPAAAELHHRTFARPVDTDWRRTSYSALSAAVEVAAGAAGAGGPAVGSEPESTPREDEPRDGVQAVPTPVPAPASGPLDAGAGDSLVSPMADLPVGATFGSLVHAVLEHADPAADDLHAHLLGLVEEHLGWWPVPDLDRRALATALVAVHDSPLGPLAHDATLRRIARSDRLREMDFELPLAGGESARGPVARPLRLGDLAPLLEQHLPPDDPVRGYTAQLAGPLGDQPLRGYLTGSVDVVLRVPEPDGSGVRYLVVDYKTNWLGPRELRPTAHSYAPAALEAAMTHSDYPLQALLYATVLHRFLRWRQPGYDPERHLGGVLYLYLRGMCGPETPVLDGHPCGVFSWRPPAALVVALSDLLDGAPPSPPDPSGGGPR